MVNLPKLNSTSATPGNPLNTEKKREMESVKSRTTDAWWLDLKFSTAPSQITIPNRKFFKMYENLSFLQQNDWLKQNHRLVTKFEEIVPPEIF